MKSLKYVLSILLVGLTAFILVGCGTTPELKGITDVNYIIGQESIDYSEGITLENGKDYTFVVDTTAVDQNKPGEYSAYYKILDKDNKVISITERKVKVDYNDEVKNITSVLKDIDYQEITKKDVLVNLEVKIPTVQTPTEPDSMGLQLDDITLSVKGYFNIQSFDDLYANLSLNVNIGAIHMIMNLSEENAIEQGMEPGVNIVSPNWFVNSDINLSLAYKEGKVYESFESKLRMQGSENEFSLDTLLGLAGGMIPEESKEIFTAILPVLSEHSEYVDTTVLDNKIFTDVISLIEMATTSIPSMITEEIIYSSPFDITRNESILVFENLNFNKIISMMGLELLIPNIDILALTGISDLRIELDGTNKQFNSLTIGAKVKDFDLKLSISTKDIVLPEIDTTEFVKVEELRLIKAIKDITNGTEVQPQE